MASYVLEKSGRHFINARCFGMYRDDGFLVLPGKKRPEEIVTWLQGFQRSVDRALGSDGLQFTATLWRMNEGWNGSSDGKVVVCTDAIFPYLDMALSWSINGNLQFSVYRKPNQELKYLNLESTHAPATFKAIPHGVALRLALLTTPDDTNINKSISDLYPEHFSALKSAGLCKEQLPSL